MSSHHSNRLLIYINWNDKGLVNGMETNGSKTLAGVSITSIFALFPSHLVTYHTFAIIIYIASFDVKSISYP